MPELASKGGYRVVGSMSIRHLSAWGTMCLGFAFFDGVEAIGACEHHGRKINAFDSLFVDALFL